MRIQHGHFGPFGGDSQFPPWSHHCGGTRTFNKLQGVGFKWAFGGNLNSCFRGKRPPHVERLQQATGASVRSAFVSVAVHFQPHLLPVLASFPIGILAATHRVPAVLVELQCCR